MWFINNIIILIIGAGLYLPTSLLLIIETTLISFFFSIFSSYNFLFQELSILLFLFFLSHIIIFCIH